MGLEPTLSFVVLGLILGTISYSLHRAFNLFVGLIPNILLTIALICAIIYMYATISDGWIGLSVIILVYVYAIILSVSFVFWFILSLSIKE